MKSSGNGDISGYTTSGDLVRTISIRSTNDTEAKILTLGARLHDIILCDGTSVVLKHSNLDEVENDSSYINGVIGRIANRVSNGRITAYENMTDVQLPLNDGTNTLHGGILSWDRRLFAVDDHQCNLVKLSMYSMDGDNGFPSTVKVSVIYEFIEQQTLNISLITENIGLRPTVTNMTLHTYFDLTGNNGMKFNSALDYQVEARNCDSYLPMTSENIPTGEVKCTEGTRNDFTTKRLIYDDRSIDFAGYDDYLISSKPLDNDNLQLLVKLFAPSNDVRHRDTWSVHVYSNQPGFQIYTSNGFESTEDDGSFSKYGSVAIEPSGYIDAPNNPQFPSVLLNQNQKRTQIIQYKFIRTC